MSTLYEVLQVSPDADPEVITAAFRALSKRYHPDVNKAPDANRVMTEINRAYEVLSDPVTRAEYDRVLSAQQNARPSEQTAHPRKYPDKAPESSLKKEYICPILGAKFVLIPAGTFMMGSPEDYPRSDFETLHQVTISKPFYIQTTMVTQGQWKKVMGNNPSCFKEYFGYFRGNDKFPVERVSWNDVQKFIRELNQMEGRNKYSLPTEAEWEYACRAGSKTAYCFGDDYERLGQYAWYNKNSGNKTHPVGQKKPNTWGLYDMHGNLFELCQDWDGDYPAGSVTDPVGPSKGLRRVCRGGSYYELANDCCSSSRNCTMPDDRLCNRGFRLLRTAE